MKQPRWLFAVVAVLLVFMCSASAQQVTPVSSLVYQPNENIFGMSYAEWSAAWWQYALVFQNSASPIPDTNGQFCNANQGGPVYFLAGAWQTVTRDCTVPAGKPIFVPIINVECSTVEPPPFLGASGQEARACAALWMDGIGLDTLKFTVDGRRVLGLSNYRVTSPFFSFVMPETDNFLFVDATSGWSVSDGFWVMLKPLSPGAHVLHFEAALVSGPGTGSTQNVTYNLTVQ